LMKKTEGRKSRDTVPLNYSIYFIFTTNLTRIQIVNRQKI
jgi:hypothetical protein